MKKVWTSVAIFAIVLVVAGIVCGVVAYTSGGSIETLMAENRQAAFTIEWLCPVNLIPYFLSM